MVYSGFKDNIWGAVLADIQIISKFNKGFLFLLCVIDIFSKYAWVAALKDKKGITVTDAFQEILKESNRARMHCEISLSDYFMKCVFHGSFIG